MIMGQLRWLIPLGCWLALLGYFGPWIDHPAAVLVVTGLDLGEYVKFLVPIQNGSISIWRESFYLPLLCVSLSLSLFAFRQELDFSRLIAYVCLVMAGVAALNMLPPAWTPSRLATPEFRLQVAAIGICIGAALCSPLLSLLPYKMSCILVILLSLVAGILPVRNFLLILPTVEELYNSSLSPGWGVYVFLGGLIVLMIGALANAETGRKR